MKKRNTLIHAWNIFTWMETAIAAVLVILLIVPMFFHIRPYVVLSGSMEPVIHTGAVSYIDTSVEFEKINSEDIIAFSTNDKNVTHRVYQVNGDSTLTTKGDANQTPDIRRVSKQEYLGKYVISIPYLGYIIVFLQNKPAIYFAAITLLLVNVAGNLIVKKLSSGSKKIPQYSL